MSKETNNGRPVTFKTKLNTQVGQSNDEHKVEELIPEMKILKNIHSTIDKMTHKWDTCDSSS